MRGPVKHDCKCQKYQIMLPRHCNINVTMCKPRPSASAFARVQPNPPVDAAPLEPHRSSVTYLGRTQHNYKYALVFSCPTTIRSLNAKLFNLSGQPRNLARYGIRFQNALGSGPLQLGLSGAKRRSGFLLVASSNRFLNLSNESADLRTPCLVPRGSTNRLANALLGGCYIGH